MVGPAMRREAAQYLVESGLTSERRACRLLDLHRSTCRYPAHPRADSDLAERLAKLAQQHQRCGYLMLHALLRQEGWAVNRKRIYRLYAAAGLQLPRRRPKRGRKPRTALPMPVKPGQAWAMDFVSDQLATGRCFRVLNVIDLYTRECLGQVVDTSIRGVRVAGFLTELVISRGQPEWIRCDNGPEFTCQALAAWAQDHAVTIDYIEPGKPVQNAHIESFNGKFRDSCLNLNWFRNLAEARSDIEAWRQHYNEVRPHSSL